MVLITLFCITIKMIRFGINIIRVAAAAIPIPATSFPVVVSVDM